MASETMPPPPTKPPLSRAPSGTETPLSTAPSHSASSDAPSFHHPRLAAFAREKYLLQVTAGPSYDTSTHVPVPVNGGGAAGAPPVALENDLVKAAIRVRIRNYRGLPVSSPAGSAYFGHQSRAREQYGIGFSFVPKVDIPADEAIWGNDFDHPIRDRLPPGFGVAVRIVKNFVDPTIELDAYAEEPWMYAPALCSFFAFRIGEKKETWDEIPVAGDEEPLQEGADGDGEEVRAEVGMPDHAGRRRKFFRSKRNRDAFVFEKGRLYQADFFNPYIDFSSKCLVVITIND
jgi:hypothetical protein